MTEAADASMSSLPNPRRAPVGHGLALAAVVVLAAAAAVAVLRHGRAGAAAVNVFDQGDVSDGTPFRLALLDPRALPDVRFADGAGHVRSLADFRGRPVLLNIWATWCVPCRTEMPALARLQRMMKELVVVPLAIDREGAPTVMAYYARIGIGDLGVYVDPSGGVARALGVPGVPATLLIDRDGRAVGRKIGPADWAAAETVAAIRGRLGIAAPVGISPQMPRFQ
jgi:thiol-disulfide isomerase/thioredoxin